MGWQGKREREEEREEEGEREGEREGVGRKADDVPG